MPRKKSVSKYELMFRAMSHFWRSGFHASSMNDLVKATNVSRHGIYNEFGGKHELFLACLSLYQQEVVTPAFARVESPGAGIEEIGEYFEFQIKVAERAGLPGPGCLIANTMTEVAPHHSDVKKAADKHNHRLRKGFANALMNANKASLTRNEIGQLASFVAISAQGLWSMSRTTSSGRALRRHAATLLELVAERLES